MTVALVANTSVAPATNGGTSGSVNTTGATFLAGVVAETQGATVAPTDFYGNTWTGRTAKSGGIHTYNRIYDVANPTVGSGHTFTISNTNVMGSAYFVAFSGVTTSSPFDVENGAVGGFGVGTLATGSVTPSQNNSLIVAGLAQDHVLNGAGTSINSGFTITNSAHGAGASGNVGGGAAYLIQGAAAAVNPTWNPEANAGILDCTATIAVYKPVADAAQVFMGWLPKYA